MKRGKLNFRNQPKRLLRNSNMPHYTLPIIKSHKMNWDPIGKITCKKLGINVMFYIGGIIIWLRFFLEEIVNGHIVWSKKLKFKCYKMWSNKKLLLSIVLETSLPKTVKKLLLTLFIKHTGNLEDMIWKNENWARFIIDWKWVC
jgi:hypothetical protein